MEEQRSSHHGGETTRMTSVQRGRCVCVDACNTGILYFIYGCYVQ